jgi:CRISPR-associated protein Csd1
MILQRLAEHYDRIAASDDEDSQLAPPGFSRQKISFCIVLEPDGRLNQIKSESVQKGNRDVAKPMLLPGQGKPPGQGLNPRFLWDNASYMLGWVLAPDADPQKREKQVARASLAFEAFRNRHIEMEPQIAHPAFSAVCSFLRDWSPDKATEMEETLLKVATNFGVFRIAGDMQYVHELVRLPKATGHPEVNTEAISEEGLCLVTGLRSQIARLHEPKIKGVAGAQSAGALLVSFNAASYESYDKSQSYNAPVSEDATFRYTNALNYLLDRRDRRISLGDSTVIFWADHANPLEDCLSEFFADPLPQAEAAVKEDETRVSQARILLTQLRDGTGETKIDTNDGQPTKFFLLGLSPNASRISVRLWVEADAHELQKRLGQHLRDIALDGSWNDEILTLQRIVRATGRAEHDAKGKLKGFNTENVSPKLAGDLARSVLTGVAYPQSLLATMIRRIHSDGEVAYARAAAIRACLVRNSRLRGNSLEVSQMLDPNSTDPAYCCGRAFALLEVIQKDSAGEGLNRTIKDSYFSSASTTPSLIFPRLCRLSQHHLAKLETGHRIHREKQLGEVLNQLAVFPRLLSLEDQGKFVLGYFHQTKDIYTSKKDKEAKEEGATS